MTTIDTEVPGATGEPALAEDVLRRVTELVPAMRERARETEVGRKMAPRTLQELTEAGVFKLMMPKDRGGYEASHRVVAEVVAQVGRADPSASWIVANIVGMNAWPAFLPDVGAEEVYATPELKSCGLIAPTGKATPVDGGVRLTGKWRWNTGGIHCNWVGLAALEMTEDGPVPISCLVRTSETTVLETWDASGMAGSATNEITGEDIFVPRERVIPVPDLANGVYPQRAYSDNPYFNRPAVMSFIFISAPSLLGMARGAMDVFLEKLPGRAITYVNYPSAVEAPVTHHQFAKATFDLEIAEMYQERLNELMDRTYGSQVGASDRIRTRAWLGQIARYSRSCVNQLFQASGASVIQHSYHLQRYFRDVNSLAQHALIQPDSSDELYGRTLLGLEPNSTMF